MSNLTDDAALYHRFLSLVERADRVTGAPPGYWRRYMLDRPEGTGGSLAGQVDHMESTLADIEQRARRQLQ